MVKSPESPDLRTGFRARVPLGALKAPEVRIIASATLANAAGSGLSIAIMPLYLTTIVGLTPGQVALGLGAGSVLGLLLATPAGLLADRRGPRTILMCLLSVVGVLSLWFPFIGFFWQFLLIATLIGGLDRGVATVASALIASVVTGEERVEVRALLRVALNSGIAVGAALASVPLAIGSPLAYKTALIVDALTFLIAAVIYRRLPSTPKAGSSVRRVPLGEVLRDVRYVRTSMALAVLAIDVTIVSIALPLWIAASTPLPTTLYSAVVVVNTVLLFLLQVPFARRIGGVAKARRAAPFAGLALFVACALFGATGSLGLWPASACLFAGVLTYVVGHLLGASALFSLGFGLANENAQGAYQGVLSTMLGAGMALGPTIATSLPLRLGAPGWLGFGLIFLVVGMLIPWLSHEHTVSAER